MHPIGHVRTPYPDRFGVPRQAGLADAVESRIELDPEVVGAESLRGLETATHLWVVFLFHTSPPARSHLVRPPRLGGNRRLGVFATRSPFRPNPIGLSAVRLCGIEGLCLTVTGGDFVDGTPVLDLKPYLPYADRIEDARCDWAPTRPVARTVRFARAALTQLERRPDTASIRQLIEQTLCWDPRPAYHGARPAPRTYGMRIVDVDVRWSVKDDAVLVESIESLT